MVAEDFCIFVSLKNKQAGTETNIEEDF